MQPKIVITNKVKKLSSKKFKIKAHKNTEVDADIEILDEGVYQVNKLSVEKLPLTMPDNKPITWLNNFAIKKGRKYINQRYKVTIPGLVQGKVVLLDKNSKGRPYYFAGDVENGTIELSDGDPAIGIV